MFRQIPSINKICQKRIVDQDQERLEFRVKNAQAQINTSLPSMYDYGNGMNKKKNQYLENQYAEIERENRILLEKITKAMQKDPQQKMVQQLSQNQQHSQLISNKRVLNSALRKREIIKISLENQNLLKRLQNKKSEYEQKKQTKFWNEQQEYVNRISEFGPNNRKLLLKFSNQSKSVPRGVQQGSYDNYLLQQNIPISSNLTYYQMISVFYNINVQGYFYFKQQEKVYERYKILRQAVPLEEHQQTNSIKLNILKTLIYYFLQLKGVTGGIYTSNQNTLQRNQNRINEKTTLLKKSKKIGLNFYLIEFTLEDKIVADDVENPTRKVLEMSENDGLKVLKKYFGNSLDMLLDNIQITDKIFIRGLEPYTTQEQYILKQDDNSYMQQSSSPYKYNVGQILKTQNDEKQRQLGLLSRSHSNKQFNAVNKSYNKQNSDSFQIIEQPDQESVDLSTKNLVQQMKLQNNNNNHIVFNQQRSTAVEDTPLNKSLINRNVHDQSLRKSKTLKMEKYGFNEYEYENQDNNNNNEISLIKKNKSQGVQADGLNSSNSQNVYEDF